MGRRTSKPNHDTSKGPTSIESRLITFGRALLDRHPVLTGIIATLWAWYIRAFVAIRLGVRSLRHSTEVGVAPFETVRIDPANVEYMTRYDAFDTGKYRRVGAVMDGDWDRRVIKFTGTDLYRAFEAHFEDGIEWRSTAFYDRVVGEIERGHERWGCTTQDEFDERCDRLDRLYESIAEHGYLTQAELASTGVTDPVPTDRLTAVDQFIYDEMTVNVARDGELLLGDGRDRFAIAKLLDLETVAVQILVRHEQWQQLLGRVTRREDGCAELPSSLIEHPDLREYCSDRS